MCERGMSTFRRIHALFPCLRRLGRRFMLFSSNVLPPASGELSRHYPLSPASKTCKATRGGWPGLAASLWNQFLERRRSWRGAGLKGGRFGGGQNVSPSPFYTPLLFGTELPKADGCADSLQIRADLRSSQRPNQKQLNSARVRERLCWPLLAFQKSAEGIYFIRFIYTYAFFWT